MVFRALGGAIPSVLLLKAVLWSGQSALLSARSSGGSCLRPRGGAPASVASNSRKPPCRKGCRYHRRLPYFNVKKASFAIQLGRVGSTWSISLKRRTSAELRSAFSQRFVMRLQPQIAQGIPLPDGVLWCWFRTAGAAARASAWIATKHASACSHAWKRMFFGSLLTRASAGFG